MLYPSGFWQPTSPWPTSWIRREESYVIGTVSRDGMKRQTEVIHRPDMGNLCIRENRYIGTQKGDQTREMIFPGGSTIVASSRSDTCAAASHGYRQHTVALARILGGEVTSSSSSST